MRVLVADDSQIMRKIIKANLMRLGVQQPDILEAPDGSMALKMLTSYDKIELVFTDLNMPNVNGVEFVQKAREMEKYKTIKIIAISEHIDGMNERLLADLGVTDFVPKPFDLDRFNQIAGPVIEEAKSREEAGKRSVEINGKVLSKEELERVLKSSEPKLTIDTDTLLFAFTGGKISVKLRDFLAICKIEDQQKEA